MLGNIANIKPLVILGAGASHDIIDHKEYPRIKDVEAHFRMPLTDGLLEDNNYLRGVQQNFPQINGYMGIVRKKLQGGMSLEKAIQEMFTSSRDQARALKDEEVFKQYIKTVFYELSIKNNNIPANNYSTFFSHMDNVCDSYTVVNFNYDFLAQSALESLYGGFNDIDTYIQGPVKLIHPHGSVLWYEEVSARMKEIKIGNRNTPNPEPPILMHPTAASKKFICPQNHQDALINALKETNVIIIIGWKGTEEMFNSYLKQYLNKAITKIILVGRDPKRAQAVFDRCGLSSCGNKYFINGFSNLLKTYKDFREPMTNEPL